MPESITTYVCFVTKLSSLLILIPFLLFASSRLILSGVTRRMACSEETERSLIITLDLLRTRPMVLLPRKKGILGVYSTSLGGASTTIKPAMAFKAVIIELYLINPLLAEQQAGGGGGERWGEVERGGGDG